MRHAPSNILKILLFIGAIAFVAVFLMIVFFRAGFPFELEWMEGGSVDHVRWILGGNKLYCEPTLDFIPFIYAPAYYYFSAAICSFTGVGYTPMRLFSAFCAIATALLILFWLRRETKRLFPAIIGACFFIATYYRSGFWFDMPRVDSLFILLIVMGLYSLRFSKKPKELIGPAFFFFLAFITKQTTLFILIPVLGYALIAHRWKGLYFVIPAVGLIALSIPLLDLYFDGWFTYYVFKLPGNHGLITDNIVVFWTSEILGGFTIAAFLAVVVLVSKYIDERRNFWFYICAGSGLIGAAWFSYIHDGTFLNNLIPLHVFLAFSLGLAIGAFDDLVSKGGIRLPEWKLDKKTTTELLRAVFYLLLIVQFIKLVYNPFDAIPEKEDYFAGKRLISLIEESDSRVFIPYHGYYQLREGKSTNAHAMAYKDIIKAEGTEGAISAPLRSKLANSFARQKFAVVILDFPANHPDHLEFYGDLDFEDNYYFSEEIFPDYVFLPVTGKQIRPQYLYFPTKTNL